MNPIQLGVGVVVHHKGRHTAIEFLLHVSQFVVAAAKRGILEAAVGATRALAATTAVTTRTIHSHNLLFRIQLLDRHFVGMNGLAAHATKAVRFLERMKDLVLVVKVFELGFGFAAQALLAPATAGLADS